MLCLSARRSAAHRGLSCNALNRKPSCYVIFIAGSSFGALDILSIFIHALAMSLFDLLELLVIAT